MSSRKDPTRREFLTSVQPLRWPQQPQCGAQADSAPSATADLSPDGSTAYSAEDLLSAAPQRTFSGENATQVAMPLGGIGAGSICLNGYGGLQDFAIRTRPETTALPEGFSSDSPEAAFAVLHIKGAPSVTKLIEGPFPAFKIFDQGLQGQGLRRGGFEGFPRFGKCTFKGEYPFGEAEFTDSSVPLEVTLLGWNPFIPSGRQKLRQSLPHPGIHASQYICAAGRVRVLLPSFAPGSRMQAGPSGNNQHRNSRQGRVPAQC